MCQIKKKSFRVSVKVQVLIKFVLRMKCKPIVEREDLIFIRHSRVLHAYLSSGPKFSEMNIGLFVFI